MAIRIQLDKLTGAQVLALLGKHLELMFVITPPESVHALDVSGLRRPDVTAWTAWEDKQLLGVGALKALSPTHGEIKSMHTAQAARGRGVATALLKTIFEQARIRRYHRLSLETGSMPEFAPARALYEKHGFIYCGPFADYNADPNSAFMTCQLRRQTVMP